MKTTLSDRNALSNPAMSTSTTYRTVRGVDVTSTGLVYVIVDEHESVELYSEQFSYPEAVLKHKAFKYSDNSMSGLNVTQNAASLIGSPTNGFVSTRDYGNFVTGPISFLTKPERMKFNSVFRFNGLLSSTMPSTIITPVSTFVMDIPDMVVPQLLRNVLSEFLRMIV